MAIDFEDQLRRALAREPAPPDFLASVLAKTSRANVLPWWRRRANLAAMAAAFVFAAAVPAFVAEQNSRARSVANAEHARQQLVEALRITNQKLVWTRQKLERKHL